MMGLRRSLIMMKRKRSPMMKIQRSKEILLNTKRKDRLSPLIIKRLTNRMHQQRKSMMHTRLNRGHTLGLESPAQKFLRWSTRSQSIVALAVSSRLF